MTEQEKNEIYLVEGRVLIEHLKDNPALCEQFKDHRFQILQAYQAKLKEIGLDEVVHTAAMQRNFLAFMNGYFPSQESVNEKYEAEIEELKSQIEEIKATNPEQAYLITKYNTNNPSVKKTIVYTVEMLNEFLQKQPTNAEINIQVIKANQYLLAE